MRTLDRTLMVVLSALVGTSLAAGCGGDDDDGGGDVSTGIAPSKLLSDVTQEEAASACVRLKTGFDRVFEKEKLTRALCTFGAAAFADTPADCVTFRDQCLEQADMQGSDVMGAVEEFEFTCDGETDLGSECTGTVGELEACVNDTLDSFDALLSNISCDDAASVSEEDVDAFGGMLGDPPASCEAVGCPGGSPFAGDDSSAAP